MKPTADAQPPLEQPTTGGSFIREKDGSLTMIDGAIAIDADPAPVAPPAPPAPPADASASDQHEG